MDAARLHLSIGVTAHRDLVAAEEPALRAAVRAFFADLAREFPDLPLCVISALAEGGDQLVAEEALALGLRLVAPLPMAQAEYERDFTDPAVLARFRALLARAEVRVLPLAPGVTPAAVAPPGDARNRQYAQLGMFVSSHCQVLLALWDGRPNAALGGTGQVVEFHLHDVMPGLSLDQVAPNLMADDEGDLVYHLGCSRRSGAEAQAPPPAARWLTLGGERAPDAGMPDAYARVFRQMEAFNVDLGRHAAAIARAPSLLLVPPLPGAPPAQARRIERQFHAADWLAVHYQHRVRRGLWWTHAIAALMGLAFILYDVDARTLYVALFLALFGAAALLSRVARRREWQRKYLDYRGLAESLRVQLYWRVAGVEVPPNASMGYQSFLQKQDEELSWIRHALRGAGLLRDEAFVADRRWLDWAIERWVGDAEGQGGQLAYFRRGTRRREEAHRATARLASVALYAGLAGAVVLLVAAERLPDPARQALLLAMGLFPLLAGIREAHSYKQADKELIRQFRFMGRLFESCRARLAHARSEAETRQILLALGRACLEEHAEWILLHRERPLEG